jgi:tetratricopeptide (TPR) repeat protein
LRIPVQEDDFMEDYALDELRALTLWGAVSSWPGAFTGGPDACASWQTVTDAIARELAQSDPRRQAMLWHRLGYVAIVMGDVRTKAHEAFTCMYERAIELEDPRLRAMAAIGLSRVHDTLGERHRSLALAQEASQLADATGDQRLLALALCMCAQFHKENGANEKARELFAEVGEIADRLADNELRMAALIGMGRTTSMAKPFTAMGYYEAAIEMAKSAGDLHSLGVSYNNLSDWKINTGRYEEAIELREKCMRIAEQLQSREVKGRALLGIAKARTLMGDLDSARNLLNTGFPTALSVGDLEGDLHACLNLAYLYVKAGDVPRASQMYRDVLERSLAAPDYSCGVFAQRALAMLGNGEIPKCAIIPDNPLTSELNADEMEAVVGGTNSQLHMIYPTADRTW